MRSILFFLFVSFMPLAISEPASRLEIQKVTDNIYALVGQRGPMSKWNFGTNATFGVVVTEDGMVLIDSGASDHAARYIHENIQKITDKPIILVINTGSEDLRWLGNAYFKSLGAKIITSRISLREQKQRANDQITRLDEYIFPKFSAGTTDVYADEVFDNEKTITIGNTKIVLKYSGPAYMPGDFYVWLPEEKVIFSGDIISTQRMLAVSRDSNTAS
ncbi:MAG: MBL fold metallo-hydrolase [Woeseiaceae bacterium]